MPIEARPRRGLPRTPGGEPWPVIRGVPGNDRNSADGTHAGAQYLTLQRRGLPRRPGGHSWPPERPLPGFTSRQAESAADGAAGPQAALRTAVVSTPPPVSDKPASAAEPRVLYRDIPRLVRREPQRIHGLTKQQWVLRTLVGAVGLIYVFAMVVLFTRWLVSTPPLRDFLIAYPGEYALPPWAPVGFPAWLSWAHFFNVFLMTLIVRSGLQIRRETHPDAYWSPSTRPERRVSLSTWFHQALDVLWLANGLTFIVLLFTTGQWVRIVPTSWAVFPNAASALLQYLSLGWPTEHGWVNYNSLQQLAYFTTVFVAAPLAAVTGMRMSTVWPQRAARVSKAYPVGLARAIHFPVMLYFTVFVVLHVTLVLTTGALRNLNHMYGGQDTANWTGFWIFSASLLIIAGGLLAARPLVIAPIAGRFGRVSR